MLHLFFTSPSLPSPPLSTHSRCQIDLLENAAMADVVLPSIVMEEVKHKNMSVHGRLRALCADETRRFFVFVNEHHR